MIFTFFDYLFYSVSKLYSKANNNNHEFAAVCVVSLMQTLNLFCFYYLLVQDRSLINKYFVGILFIALLVFNYIRYIYKETRSYKILDEKIDKTKKQKKGIIAILYIILSFVLCLALVIYLE